VASIEASREKEQPLSGRSSPISLHSSTNSPAPFHNEVSLSLWILVWVIVAALGPLDPGLGAGQRELSDVNPRLEQLLRALSEEGVLDLLLLLVGATGGGLVILLRAEEEVDLALGLQVNHERAEAITALHLALAEERDGLAQPAEARAHGGLVDGHGHGVGTAPLEELLHRALVALPRSAVVVGYLIPHLVLGVGG
jgi:hypothetical protein